MTSLDQAVADERPVPSGPELIAIKYDDVIVRKFILATMIWGVVGMLVGVIAALQLAYPDANTPIKYFSFGRLRPLHTNAVIFAFAGNAIFGAIYYSTQRLLKTRMYSDLMSKIHFWGWQSIIVAAAITLPMGFTQTKEYAELEWPVDIAITVIWVVFAVNFFMTLKVRREKHLYVAIWFYIATIIVVAMLHVVNNLVLPVAPFKAYSVYSGVQDAMVQWWYGHNAVAFFLTTPFLGLMYYFLPKAAERPIYSYKLSILHFWSLIFLYIWAGPHHLHYTSLPEWASTLGMVFSVMLWMPSWGGMINGLFTLRGAWHKLREDPILKFFVVAITFYGMATFEGPMMSVKAVNALTHYTDYTIAHVHSAALGWNGFMTFGMIYWLIPRLWQTELWSKRLANTHFWVATVGMLLYIIALYSASVTQGLQWRAFDESGILKHDFMETVVAIMPMYWVRLIGGTLYLTGALLASFNLFMTLRTSKNKGKKLEDPVAMVPKSPSWRMQKAGAKTGESLHRRFEGWPLVFTILTIIAVASGSIIEIVPMLMVKSNVPPIASVMPYTALEIEGRDMYVAEGCHTCHTQMIRPMRHEIERYGEYNKPGEDIYERPFLWGSKRTGPDLSRIGNKYTDLWHVRHMENPRSTSQNSIMPAYRHMLRDELNLKHTESKLRGLQRLGTPYTDAQVENAVADARAQAKEIAGRIEAAEGPSGLEDRSIIALVAYMQRIGTDISRGRDSDAADAPAEERVVDNADLDAPALEDDVYADDTEPDLDDYQVDADADDAEADDAAPEVQP